MRMSAAPQTSYGFGVTTTLPYDEAIAAMKSALKEQGFGVLTEIDVKRTMKEKRDVDFRRYVILGACNPALAQEALTAELDIGLLLPCNVVVYEVEGGSVVEVMDPEAAMGIVKNPALDRVARDARTRLEGALATLAKL